MATYTNLHEDMVHDAVLDYYGKRLATCSSDRTIKIFAVDGNNHRLEETLRGHDGPVWQVAWAHPRFGTILASAGYDGKVLIWRDDNGRWSLISEYTSHQASVNSVQWAPHELGALLLCASSDGNVSIVEFKDDGSIDSSMVVAHPTGCNTATWDPSAGMVRGTGSQPIRRFSTGGCDNTIKIWSFNEEQDRYVEEAVLKGHTDWVRDIAWSASVFPKSYIASASQDKTVLIWTQEGDGEWVQRPLQQEKFSEALWRVSWSLSGNILAVSGGDNKVTLWKESIQGTWETCATIDS
ncbi:hypothetical protein CANCADRAFT_864 [Tortispora caseinolytica NRRL Y-17796]|uniref:Uncharacterized protein n=1 Tax=Tortispora caseinolytica NRRL Y-17796 TaxID=767744 RepID=A0A1E4TKL8_9ASCO|nr:hypothetical protein CANCADRAFT_864 [Tortispora caseinolytica NRRL Y-17796]